ncbi:MAG: type III-B CRISPR module RAMP protein Cmr6 [Candidatus Sericytochromatia bacterium]
MRRVWQKTAHALNTTDELKKEWEGQKVPRQNVLQAQNARLFNLQTQAPLMVEASHILGHTGLEFHPLYGFPYLPASRLKGLIREYAETHWLPAQSDQNQAKQQIAELLGGAALQGGDSGSVIIHDAWPEQWPSVQTDLQACHHRPYYQRREAAGDWQTPDPRYFLSLRSGARFGFALTQRRPGQEEGQALVENWLVSALSLLGYGSGRQSGHGLMKSPHTAPTAVSPHTFSATLSLNTPGFYRGAGTRSEDCQLRASSLRGLLRWWWRTLHSGFLPQRSLVLLENALWGNRGKKGAIRIQIQPQGSLQARRFQEYELTQQMPAPEHPKTKPGLSYLTYGTGDNQERAYYLAAGTRWQISLTCDSAQLLPGSEHPGVSISAETVLEQAKAALWLFCQFGGSGQRMRKGLGSFQLPTEWSESLENLQAKSEQLREDCGFSSQFQERFCDSPSLQQRIEQADILTPWKNEWFALHQLGYAYQSFMQNHKHKALKRGLGLPRDIGAPIQGEWEMQTPVKDRLASPLWLHFDRQAETGNLILRTLAFPNKHNGSLADSQSLLAELLNHLRSALSQAIENYPLEPEIRLNTEERKARPQRGTEKRPPFQRSANAPVLGEKGESTAPQADRSEPRREWRKRPERSEGERPPRSDRGERSPRPERSGEALGRKPRRESGDKPFRRSEGPGFKSTRPSAPRPVQAGDRVEVALLEERTKKGGWRAQHAPSGLSGPVVNSGLVPAENEVGSSLTLIVHSINRFEMAFRVPTAADEAKDKGKKKTSRAEV